MTDDFATARSMFESDVASKNLGIELRELSDGYAQTSMTVTSEMVNGYGITHGGYVFAVADTTFARACNWHAESAAAARADMRYLRPTRVGDVLIATAHERVRFGRNGICDVTVTCGDDIVAEFRGDSRTVAQG